MIGPVNDPSLAILGIPKAPGQWVEGLDQAEMPTGSKCKALDL